jgi:hypothetical protein
MHRTTGRRRTTPERLADMHETIVDELTAALENERGYPGASRSISRLRSES